MKSPLSAAGSAERGAHLLHLQPHGLQALGMAFLQDVELGLSQVQRRAARSVQGIHPGPWGKQAVVSMLSGGRRREEGEGSTHLLAAVW